MDEMDKALQNVSKEQGWAIKEILPLKNYNFVFTPVVQTLCNLLSSAEHKRRYSEECTT